MQPTDTPANTRSFRFWASAFYFAFFAAGGSLVPFFNAYYQQSGIPLQQIGLLASLPMLMNLFANPLWAMAADAFHLHGRLLPLSMLLTVPAVWLLTHVSGFWALAGLVLLYAFCSAPIIALGDHAVTEALGAARYEYGRLRIWGAVGFGLSAWVGGYLMEWFGIQRSVMMSLGVFIATRLPKPRLVVASPFWKSIRILTTDRRWYSFLGGIFLAGIGFSVINNYLILYMRSLGAGEGLFGLATAIAGVSELPIFFFSTLIMKRWSPRGLIGVAFGALALRLLLVSLVQDPRLILAIQLLHGLSFSAIWTAGVSYSSEIAPPGLGASAQSLFGITLFAMAGMIGAYTGGQVYQQWGAAVLFQTALVVVIAGAAVFYTSFLISLFNSTHQ
jgi:MFS transporter, PPP family, 3-phenylpropionic acid transporter